MTGLQRVARRAILARLKAHAGLTALVPPSSIFGQTVPADRAWPFIKLGPPQTLPITAACLNGGAVAIPADGFAKNLMSGQRIIETAEDHAGRIGGEFEAALHLKGETVTVDGAPVRLRYALTDIRLFVDGGEPGAFHYSALINARVIAE